MCELRRAVSWEADLHSEYMRRIVQVRATIYFKPTLHGQIVRAGKQSQIIAKAKKVAEAMKQLMWSQRDPTGFGVIYCRSIGQMVASHQTEADPLITSNCFTVFWPFHLPDV